MHLIIRDGASLDEIGQPQDLELPPADFILLSFSDSDLGTFRAAVTHSLSAHFINLAALRHPISVDLFIEKTVPGTKAILLRLLGGLDYWRYGTEELAHACRKHGVVFAVSPGDGRPDPRLPLLSTLDADEQDALDQAFKAGGRKNAARVVAALQERAKGKRVLSALSLSAELPDCGVYRRAEGREGGSVAIIFYRSFLLAGDVQPIDALIEKFAFGDPGLSATAYYLPSLKDEAAALWLRGRLKLDPPDIIVNITAFSARTEDGASPLDEADCPVIQAAMVSNREDGWRVSTRGLSSTDLAMHVVLPEMDGRLFAGVISFKDRDASGMVFHSPHAVGIDHVAGLVRAWVRLRRKPRADRKLALVLSTYPGRPDQIAHAVGLDGPVSALRIAQHLQQAGYAVGPLPNGPAELLSPFEYSKSDRTGFATWPLARYEAAFAELPQAFQDAVIAKWGVPQDDAAFASGSIALPIWSHGNFLICLQPERGGAADRKAEYHDPNLPPRHGYVAFYLWLRHHAAIDALIHLGAHGTLEWLPGKAAALSEACAPQALIGPMPVIYPFIVNDPGEAAQAKRRISALTIGHNTPPLIDTEPSSNLRDIERLLDEYAAADGLDENRRKRLARQVLDAVAKGGLEEACGIRHDMKQSDALTRVDAFLCDVKVLAIRDGLHILDGGELDAITRALDGRFIEPGPSGAPSRGRADVLPTGRNLYSVDTRTIPTSLACENGARMADAIIARYVEDHGDWPRSLVLDLWGSQTMRTGGEEFGAALALMGVSPTWNHQSSRVTGFEILPLMKLNRPRVDVTLRISGLLRDMFPAQLAFFHAAVQRLAARDEDKADNPLRGYKGQAYRIFGAPDGSYGAGVSQRIDASDWQTPHELGECYLASSSTAYAGEGQGISARASFEGRVKAASGFIHIQDHSETDILSSLDFAAHEGGFAVAAAALGNNDAAIYHGDTARPSAPKVRTLAEEATRVLHGRALSARWLQGQMRHGFRGAAEIAGTVDAAFAFAATAEAVSSAGLEHLYDAYLGDPTIASFLARENGAALEAIRSRFKEAIARSLWKPRRNDLSGLEGDAAP